MKRNVIIGALSALMLTAPVVLATAAPAAADPIVFAQMMMAAPNPHVLQGTVTYYSGYNLGLRFAGHHTHVKLHPGTIIHPTGITLHAGMLVRVHGWWGGGVFHADRISLVH
ncbi:MAG TPA: hypothetical protein VME66_06885 [Candidatus Acidoferrales bacterium]|nr:hypothetical protein [Candidatus Acidoferrales bacterium]